MTNVTKSDTLTSIAEESMMKSRPKWNDREVQAAAVKVHIADVSAWLGATIPAVDLSSTDSQQRLLAITTLAVQESADAYAAGRYLENIMEWPVDRELIRVLDHVYAEMPKVAESCVHAWVMAERVRFPAKPGFFVRFKVGPVEMQGTAEAVIQREARAIVSVKVSPTATKNMSVNAEDVVSARAPTTPSTKPGGGVPPTGGTPAAQRGGAILKEARAA